MKLLNYLKLIGIFLLVFNFNSFANDTQKKKLRVVFLGIDGLSVDGVRKAKTPNLDKLMKKGSYSLEARGVFPTVSGPNWASMILGMGPEFHGVLSNSWFNSKDKKVIKSVIEDEKKFATSVFDLIKSRNPKYYLALINEWEPISYYFNPKSANFIKNTKSKKETLDEVYNQLIDKNADFVFVQFNEVDGAGHGNGWESDVYYKAVEGMDKSLGELFDRLKEGGVYEDIVFIVSSDHGGKGCCHGGNTMEELLIPWIIYGPNIRSNLNIKTRISTYDTPATIAYLFDADIPDYWQGKPIVEVIKK